MHALADYGCEIGKVCIRLQEMGLLVLGLAKLLSFIGHASKGKFKVTITS